MERKTGIHEDIGGGDSTRGEAEIIETGGRREREVVTGAAANKDPFHARPRHFGGGIEFRARCKLCETCMPALWLGKYFRKRVLARFRCFN